MGGIRVFVYRPVRRRRHRELFALAAVLLVLGAFVLDGIYALAVFGSLIAFYPGIMRRLGGEDVSNVERAGRSVSGGA